ncbi:MAG: BACON domain-containing protein, partial [Vicinamibacterales bacterium]
MTSGLSLLEFLRAVNGATAAGTNAPGFVLNALDAMRAVEFIHEYQVPVSLLAEHGASTMLVVPPAAATVSATPQIVTLHATVTNTTTVNGGSVIFTVRQADGSAVGASATSDAVISGAASAAYVLPALTPAQLLTITAAYSGAAGFAPSVATSTLTVTISDPCAATLSPTTTTAEALGGTMTVSLTIAGACAWSASADAPWLSVSSPSGTGSATIEYVVERNVSGVTRTGHVIVANQVLTVTQPPVPLLTSDFSGDGHGVLLWQPASGT